jgi:hypothetical protein
MSTELLVFNGINGADGRYLVPPMTVEDLGRISLGHRWRPEHLNDLQYRGEAGDVYALRTDLNNQDLSEAGWGIIFPADAEPEKVEDIRKALSELLEHRKDQAGNLYREYYREPKPIGYIHGESKDDFLSRHGAGPGPVDPKYVPYYLLIVGDPQSIPFAFQYELDVQYAVGRIYFDTLDKYAQYARSVVDAETPGKISLPRQAVFFGVANEDDGATQLSAEMLVPPLAKYVAKQKEKLGWDSQLLPPEESTKTRLGKLLGGDETPALLFTASHGLGFPHGHPLQIPFQGALLCQDWPGPVQSPPGKISRDHYLGAEDIADDASLLGLISFHFACFGAGTPYWDNFSERAFTTRSALAPQAFLAALPQRLLSHPRGGALAVIGHIDRAWSYSFKWKDAGQQTTVFESILYDLLSGKTVGAALDPMNIRYAEIATMLNNELETVKFKKPNLRKMAGLWTANNDARDYALLGDPAVRIPVAEAGAQPAGRRAIEQVPNRDGDLPLVLVSEALPEKPPTPHVPETGTVSARPAAPAYSGQPQTVLDGLVAMSRYAEMEAEDFGTGMDMVKGVIQSLSNALKSLTSKLAEFAEDVSGLDIVTYVGENVDSITYDVDTKRFTGGVKQRALTHISADGDTQVCVPMDAGELDETLWAIHTDMVNQAMANRTAMMKAVADSLIGLLGPPTVR